MYNHVSDISDGANVNNLKNSYIYIYFFQFLKQPLAHLPALMINEHLKLSSFSEGFNAHLRFSQGG